MASIKKGQQRIADEDERKADGTELNALMKREVKTKLAYEKEKGENGVRTRCQRHPTVSVLEEITRKSEDRMAGEMK
jgi:hypothetical protein